MPEGRWGKAPGLSMWRPLRGGRRGERDLDPGGSISAMFPITRSRAAGDEGCSGGSVFGALRGKSSHPRVTTPGADGLFGDAFRLDHRTGGEGRVDSAGVAAGRDKLQKLAGEP